MTSVPSASGDASTGTPYAEDRDATPRILRVLRRLWKTIAATTLVAIAASLVWSSLQSPKYTASAALYFRDPGFSQQLLGNSFLAPAEDPTRAAATNTELVSLDTVSRRTSTALGGSVTPVEVRAAVAIVPQGQSDVVKVQATDESAAQAARIANTFARQFVLFRQEANRATLARGLAVVRRQLQSAPATEADTRALRSRVEELQLLESLQTGNAELVQVALPPKQPSSPRTKRNAVIAGFLGLLAGLALAFGLDRIDRRVRDPEDAARLLGRPLLGAVPESRRLSATAGIRVPEGADGEAFRLLRANLRYFTLAGKIRTVLVTSAAPGDGKTTVALNLARAAAESSERVLLVEVDLRKPTLVGRIGGDVGGPGLSGVLSGQVALEDAIVRLDAPGERETGGDLFVLSSGPIPPNPTDLVEGPHMQALLAQASEHFDLVILDTPPLAVVPDAIPLVRAVDGVIVVARLGKTTQQAIVRLRDQLGHLDASVLGLIANGAGSGQDYAYGYYYAQDPSDTPAPAPTPTATAARPPQ